MQPPWKWKFKLDCVATAVAAVSDTFLLKSLRKWYAQLCQEERGNNLGFVWQTGV